MAESRKQSAGQKEFCRDVWIVAERMTIRKEEGREDHVFRCCRETRADRDTCVIPARFQAIFRSFSQVGR